MKKKEAPVSFERFTACIKTIKEENEYVGKCSEQIQLIIKKKRATRNCVNINIPHQPYYSTPMCGILLVYEFMLF